MMTITSERALGKEHPSTLASMNNLASVLSQQGKYEQALQAESGRSTLRQEACILTRL